MKVEQFVSHKLSKWVVIVVLEIGDLRSVAFVEEDWTACVRDGLGEVGRFYAAFGLRAAPWDRRIDLLQVVVLTPILVLIHMHRSSLVKTILLHIARFCLHVKS